MKLSTALRLARVSHLPTITSNVLAAIALAGVFPATSTVAIACAALSAMYVGGMFLNDAFDRDSDRIDRRDRPIPAGEAHAAVVFDAGFVLVLAGIVAIAALALATGAGGKPILSAIALGTLIVFYDAKHKGNPWAPLLLGLCRAGVYTTAALLVRPDLCAEVLVGAALLVAYFVGFTFTARDQRVAELTMVWPLALVALPFVIARPSGPSAVAIYAGFALWVLRALVQLRGRLVREAVTSLVAGIALLDALLIANLGRVELAGAAIAAFVASMALHKLAPDA
jgi:4-hydroxybenzoate polyprenyltransferase